MKIAAALLVSALTACVHAHAGAQPARPTPPTAAPMPPAADPAVPQQTTASFADWTVRCAHLKPGGQVCEAVQTVTSQDRPVAQIAIGRVEKGQPLHLTILVPPSVSFAKAPDLATLHEGDPPTLELAWRRCLPGGCMAEAVLPDDTLRRVRAWTDGARVAYADAGGHGVSLPFSSHGLVQALDALAKEDGG